MVARIVSSHTDAEVSLVDTFKTVKATLPGNAAVTQLREAAFGAFVERGLPHRRIEAWHYTDLRALMSEALPLAPTPDAQAMRKVEAELAASQRIAGTRLVMIDGTFAPALSDAAPKGVTIRSLATVLAEGRADLIEKLAAAQASADDSIVALNAALMQDGVVIEVAEGTQVAEPIQILYATGVGAKGARFFRSLVTVGSGAAVRIAESSLADGGRSGQSFGCLIFNVGDRAVVDHSTSITRTEAGSLRLDTFVADVGSEATFNSFALIHGEGLVRRQLFLRLIGDTSTVSLRGVSLLKGRDHADTTLDVEHIGQGCEGRETFRYILDDGATGVFQGRIRVAPGAQKTDGKMLSRALLLSDEASMHNKPELEIFADDVACGHGATCGGLDEDQIFYMQARGLTRGEAESLLLEAFASEFADELGHEGLAATFRAEVADWLAARNRQA